MLRSPKGGRAGRPRTLATTLAVATISLLLAAASAEGESRTGTAGPGTKNPADASTRIAGGLLSYDTSGRLQATVRLAAPTGLTATPAISVTALAGTFRNGRCDSVPGMPNAVVGGLPDTFGYPPVPDPNFFYLTQIKLLMFGDDTLGGESVTVSLAGSSVNMTATTPVIADKTWNCGWLKTADQGEGAKERGFPDLDQTDPFPLLGPGAGVALGSRSLALRGRRVQLSLTNSGAAASGRIAIRAGRVTLVRAARYTLGMLSGKRLALPLTRAGRALLRRQKRVSVTVTVTAQGGKKVAVGATLRV